MLLRTPDQTTLAPPLVIEAAGRDLGKFYENADRWLEIDRRIRLMRECFKRFGPELYDNTTAPLSQKGRMLKDEVTKILLYGCVTWTLRAEQFAKLRTTHHQVLL